MDIRFRTCNVRSLCRVGSLNVVASELAKYKFDLVTVQEDRWDEGKSQLADSYMFFCGRGNSGDWLFQISNYRR
jgi:hypothetical protein